jgi:hypothetical protein
MSPVAVRPPVRRVGAPEPVQRVLDTGERDTIASELDGQDDHVDIEEEVEIDVRHVEDDGLRLVGVHQPRALHVGPAQDPDRRLASPGAAGRPLAVEESLHVGQERDELAVVPLLEERRLARELVVHLAPYPGGVRHEALPGRGIRIVVTRRHQLEGPEQDLVEVTDGRVGRSLKHV